MSTLVSIVVPVYNVEKYITSCVESIINQTYHNIEIILVDDGAKDSSGRMCDEFAIRDHRIRVIHKPNGGLSDARNAGLADAHGEFVCFIDSDDWIESETIEQAVSAMTEDVDVVVWGYYKDTVDQNGRVVSSSTHSSHGVCAHNGGYKHLLQKEVFEQTGYAWNKLYRTSLLKNKGFLFEKGLSLIEDIIFIVPVFCEAQSVKYIDYLGSHYIQRQRTTLGNAYYPNRLEMKLRAAEQKQKLLTAYGASEAEAEDFFKKECSGMLYGAAIAISSLNEPYGERRRKLHSMLKSKECGSIIQNLSAKGWKQQLVALLARMRMVDLLIIFTKRKA